VALVYGGNASREERRQIEGELIAFLHESIDTGYATHDWLVAFKDEVLETWRKRARVISEDWGAIDKMIERTDPASSGEDMPLAHLGGLIEGHGRLNLSTLHSAKGREFDCVILFGMNADILPGHRDRQKAEQLREARRLFYVGVTRPRKELHLTFTEGNHSPWVKELFDRTQESAA
jgi:DNA helicase-2/ATP-dependent DNA helicase PcrA